MHNKNKIFLGIFIFVVIIAAIAGLSSKKSSVAEPLPSESVSTSTPISGETPIEISGTGDYTIEKVPIESYPSLERPIVLPEVFEGEARKTMEENLALTIADLKRNEQDMNAWFRLAVYRKMINDYAGAAEIFEFLTQSNRNNPILFGNLGELYHLYLKNYSASEANYKKAISLGPNMIVFYRGLHELYKFSYKTETSAAADILKEGIAKNPEAIDLVVLLAQYYGEKKDAVSARAYYEKAAAEARRQGNETLAGQIESDLQRLK